MHEQRHIHGYEWIFSVCSEEENIFRLCMDKSSHSVTSNHAPV